MHDVTEAAAAALILGCTAGLSPGPLLALVLRESLRHGAAAGVRVALVPLATDAPLIALAVFIGNAPWFRGIGVAVLSLAGGAYLVWLALQTMSLPPPAAAGGDVPAPGGLGEAMIANVLSPSPWLFWLGVGVPLLAGATAAGWSVVATFVLVFYAALVGSKAVLAIAVGRGRGRVSESGYRWVMRLLGALLAGLGVVLFRDGIVTLMLRYAAG